ncbi:Concanavalin A-like lectin/glucanases superfamily protein [Marivirga sericea]|uniref:Concanavalin A-like lectin/glucanases superfamily protein n=2 Tax=Marivirga sericea TaxID=1028 RepID=A0A1X7LB21_9BACT|nr:Concanavalin A-like lectin/glucanases superfamily protein [Marivirga sericea]
MRMLSKMKYWIGALMLSALIFTACNDDDEEAPALTIEALTAVGTDITTGDEITVDLNSATSASDVPPDAVFEITFDREIDAATATASNISVSDGDNDVAVTVAASGSVVTVTPEEELVQGTDYTVTVAAALAAADGGTVTNGSRTFKTAGRLPVVAPQSDSQVAYWKFDGDAADEMGNYADGEEIAIEYQEDRFGTVNSTAYFDGDASIIEVPSAASLLDDAESFTISFWMKTQPEGHVNENGDQTGMFVFGLGAFFGIQYEIFGSYEGSKYAVSYINEEGVETAEDMFFPSEATDNTNGGWQGWDFARSLSPTQMQDILVDSWYHNVFTYNAEEKKGYLYFNGQLMKSFDFNLWPDGDAKRTISGVTYRGAEPEVFDDIAFGFIHSRAGSLFDDAAFGNYDSPTSQHFKGWLDDFRIIHASYSEGDVTELYEAERP